MKTRQNVRDRAVAAWRKANAASPAVPVQINKARSRQTVTVAVKGYRGAFALTWSYKGDKLRRVA